MTTTRRGFAARLAALFAAPFAKKVADAYDWSDCKTDFDEPNFGGVIPPWVDTSGCVPVVRQHTGDEWNPVTRVKMPCRMGDVEVGDEDVWLGNDGFAYSESRCMTTLNGVKIVGRVVAWRVWYETEALAHRDTLEVRRLQTGKMHCEVEVLVPRIEPAFNDMASPWLGDPTPFLQPWKKP